MSDKLGRKSLIYLTLVPFLLTQLLIVYMAQPKSLFGIKALYFDAVLIGLTGGGLLLETGVNSYVCTSFFLSLLSSRYSLINGT